MSEVKEKIVERGVKAQALIDRHLAAAYRAANQYAKAVEDGVKNGFFVSPLEAKARLAEARSLPGDIAKAAKLAADLHITGTQLAKDNEVDLGSVDTVGGVTFVRRASEGISIMSGGDR